MRSGEILAAIADSVVAVDNDTRVSYLNHAAQSLFGCGAADLAQRPLADLLPGSGGDAEDGLLAAVRATLSDGRTRGGRATVPRLSGGRDLQVTYSCSALPDGAVLLLSDVAVAGRAVELRALETRILDMVSAAAPLAQMLEEIAVTVDRLLPGVRSSILLLEGGTHLRHGAAPKLPEAYTRALDGIPIGPTAGSCGAAAFRRAAVTVTDIEADPLWADYRQLALQHGLRACWSTPVLDARGAVLATFAMYYGDCRAPGEEEHRITERIGQFVRTAIERHNALAALKASEERLRTIAEHMQEVFWMTDAAKSSLLYISAAYETVWGRPRAELTARPSAWMDAVHPDDKAALEAAVARQKEAPYSQSYRILRPDGAVRWIDDRAFPVLDADGRVTKIVGICQDVTERRMAEMALQERVKELGSLYRILSLLSDQSRATDALCRDIANALVAGLLHPEIAVAAIDLDGETHRSAGWGEPQAAYEVPIDRAGFRAGRLVVGYRLPCAPQPGGTGPLLAEEVDMIRAVAAHLGQMLHNRRMAAQLAQSERLSAIGQLSGGVAHDFNNLLTVILGNAEALSQKLADDARMQPLAAMTLRAAERGAELTARLLAFARRQPLHPQSTALPELVSGLYPMLKRLLPENVEIGLGLGEDLRPAMVDPAQLEDALLNLVLNARDAMPVGGTLTLEIANHDIAAGDPELGDEGRPGRYVAVTVTDTGCGMDATIQKHVFEPFFTTKHNGSGSGLGLSMVYGFAMQSNGFVRLRSAPGRGTRISVFLPCAPEGSEVRTAESRPPPPPPLPAGCRVLLVEDNDMVRDHVGGLLKELGFHVVATATGTEALELLRCNAGDTRPAFDLLFTDVVMPGGMSGPELAAQACREWPGLRVLLSSGHAEEWHRGEEPDFPLLRKPFHRHELALALSRALTGPEEGHRVDR